MKEYKVIEVSGTDSSPSSKTIEKDINKMVNDGWKFVQLATGAGGGSDLSRRHYDSWVYIVFEREK